LAPQGDMFTKLTHHQTPTVYGNHKTSTPLPDPYQTPLVQNPVLCSVAYPVHMVTDDAPKEKQVRVKNKGVWLQPPFIQLPLTTVPTSKATKGNKAKHITVPEHIAQHLSVFYKLLDFLVGLSQ
nr:hypothetical protein [Tanacetum cinerariifolium]